MLLPLEALTFPKTVVREISGENLADDRPPDPVSKRADDPVLKHLLSLPDAASARAAEFDLRARGYETRTHRRQGRPVVQAAWHGSATTQQIAQLQDEMIASLRRIKGPAMTLAVTIRHVGDRSDS